MQLTPEAAAAARIASHRDGVRVAERGGLLRSHCGVGSAGAAAVSAKATRAEHDIPAVGLHVGWAAPAAVGCRPLPAAALRRRSLQPDAGSAPRGPVGPAAGEAEALPGAALASVAGAAAVEPTELAMAAAASTEVAASEASEASEAEEAERLPAQSGSSSSGRSRRWQMQLLQSQGRL